MVRLPKSVVLAALALSGLFAVAAPAREEEPAKGIALPGSVKKAQAVDAAALAAPPLVLPGGKAVALDTKALEAVSRV